MSEIKHEDGKIDDTETFLRKSVAELLLIVSQSLPFIGVSPYEAPNVMRVLSNQLMEKLRANLLELDLVRGNLISDATDNQLAIMTKQLAILHKKDAQALKAAQDHVIEHYTSLKRHATKEWAFDEEDLAKLRYNDSPGKTDGYLIAGVASSQIVDYEDDSDGPIWTIEVIPDVGFKLDPEEYQVYQVLNGDWIVEQ